MDVWTIKGFETWKTEKGDECVRLYVTRPAIKLEEGHTGSGEETNRLFYKKQYVPYPPVIGDQIVAVDGRYGVAQILVVGHVDQPAA